MHGRPLQGEVDQIGNATEMPRDKQTRPGEGDSGGSRRGRGGRWRLLPGEACCGMPPRRRG
jgi:hypothetical protein